MRANRFSRRSRNKKRNSAVPQVLFVAMDEVSFDFFDDLSPGHTALFRFNGSVRKTGGGFIFLLVVLKSTLHSFLPTTYPCVEFPGVTTFSRGPARPYTIRKASSYYMHCVCLVCTPETTRRVKLVYSSCVAT